MNLDIEGTKHEKVVIIVLAYVIGFTAGFICFGLTQGIARERAEKFAVTAASEVTPSVVANEKADGLTPVTPVATTQSSPTTVSYDAGKLQVKNGENVYLLSMKSTGLDSAALSAFKNQGMHAEIPMHLVSPDGKYVYFCEQQSTSDSCNSFIFNVDKNVIEYVTVDGKKLSTPGAEAKTATWTEHGLSIGKNTSAEATAPATLLASE